MKIAIGCDHIVTDTKIKIVDYLKKQGHEVVDVGTYDFTRTHYPIYGKKVAQAVANQKADFGITLCGTGVGITNSANKTFGARAALVRDVTSAIYARQELNANIIGFGAKVVGDNLALLIIDTFLTTPYIETTANKALIAKIDEMEANTNANQQLNDNSIFATEIQKWNEGFYHD